MERAHKPKAAPSLGSTAHVPTLRARLGSGLPLDRALGSSRSALRVLDPGLRASVGLHDALGERVRIHADDAAESVARSLGADAFAFGTDVGFARGAFRPDTRAGTSLLRHELAHVRQSGGVSAERLPVERTDSPAEREALAVERGAALPATAAHAPALRLRSVSQFGLSWNADHSDVGIASTAAEIAALVRALTGSSTTVASGRATALAAAAGTRADLLVRALDFLRDNRALLPVGIPGALLDDVAAFCAGRADAVASLTDDFYRDVLVAALYTPGAGDWTIDHMSGSHHGVPRLGSGTSDFGATTSPTTSLQRPAPPAAGRPITGGFPSPLSLTVGYGTRARFPSAGVADALIRAHSAQIDPLLEPGVREIAEDKYVLRALRSYLSTDHGRFVATASGGHYDGASPPTIEVGTSGGALDTRVTLFHELLHYVFDRSDSVLAEASSSGGADHPAIEALQTKFTIIELIRAGQPPLDASIESAFGRFLAGSADRFPLMRDAITRDDPGALTAAVGSGFVTTVVSSGLLGEASSLGFLPGASSSYVMMPDQFRDLAFVWAQCAVIVRRAMVRAAAIARRLRVRLADVFARAEWQSEMSTFLRSFVRELQSNPRQGVAALEARL